LPIGGLNLRAQTIVPDNDSFAARSFLFGASASTTGKNTGATFEPGEPDPSFQGEKSVWWTWTAPTNGAVTITTTSSSFDTILTVFTGSVLSNLVLVAFNDTETNTSTVTFNAVGGTAYQISVDGASGSEGNISLQLSMGPSQTPPANDNFANRITLIGSHLSNVPGSNIGATAEPGEPFHADGIGEKSVWWTWTAPASGGLTLTTQGSTIDTLLAVYTGTSVDNLTFIAANDEDPLSIYTSRITCNVTAGTSYQIAVDGFEGEAGDIRLRLDLDVAFPVPANDNFANRITLTGNSFSTNVSNIGASYEPGEPMHLVTLGGKSVWWQWTAPSSGGVTLTASNNLVDTLVCVYKGTSLANLTFVAGNDEDFLTAIEGDSTAYFNVTAGTTYQIVVDGVDGASGNFLLKLVTGSADPVPANDNFANRIVLSGSNVTVTNTTLGATLEPGEPLHRGYYGGSSIWYRWTSPGTGFVTIDTIGSLFDTILAVYTGSTLSGLTEIAGDDESGGNYTSLVTFPTKSNVTYQIAVDGYDGDAYDLTLHVKFTTASYTLTVSTNPAGAGTVAIDPLPDQAGKYAPGSVVTLTATPNVGVLFTGWTGGINLTNNPVTLTVNSNKTVVAGFFIIPTNKVWTGASVSSGNWSDSDNWNPSPPVTGDFLFFPPGALQLTSNTNDLPANTTVGSITFGDAGYLLSGNALSIDQGIFCTNSSGTNTINLNIRLNANLAFECTNPAVGLELTAGLNLNNRTLTARAAGEISISGAITGTGSIVKTNSGGLSFLGGGANSYTGTTTVNQGTLRLNKNVVAIVGPLVIGDGTGGANNDVVRSFANSQISSSSAVTINSSGQLDLNGFTGAAGSLTMTGGSVTTGAGSLALNGNVTINSSSSQASISGSLLLQGAARTFTIADGAASIDLLIFAVIANGSGTGSIIKNGPGILQLSGANTYSGSTTVNDGTLSVAHSSGLGGTGQGTVVNGNAILLLNGVTVSDESLTLSNATVVSDSNNNTWSGNIALIGNSLVNATTNGPLNLSGIISGSGTLTKAGAGTLTFSGNKVNTYSGLTTINQGTLLLSRSTTNAVPGPLLIGDGTGGANADLVRFTANSQLASTSAVTIDTSGQLDLNGFNGAVGSLTMTSGSVTTGAGTLSLNGGVTINSASSPASISGNLSLQGDARIFNVADGSAATDCVISATIVDGSGTGAMIKTGAGTLQLSGINTFSGTTTINAGNLAILNAVSLGSTNQGTMVNSNGLLSVGGITVVSEGLTLGGGALQSTAASNAWTGNLTLSNSSTINVITNTTLNLLGVISGTGSFSKNGDGTLIFSGDSPNTYSGVTTVNQGILMLSKTISNALPGPILVGDGTGGVDSDVVRLTTPQQISIGTSVTINSSGLMDLMNVDNSIGSISGLGHVVLNGLAAILSVGYDNSSTTFDGQITGSGGIAKLGTGTLVLNSDNSYSGQTLIDAGGLIVNGSQPFSSVTVNPLGLLGGTGLVGNLSGGGIISPGLSPGILGCNDATFSSNTTFHVELNGTTAGTDYDQLSAENVSLAGALDVALGFTPGPNDSFIIINNLGSAPIAGTFDGLAEGDSLVVGQTEFRITYVGGSGSNDVVLAPVSTPTIPTISIHVLNDGSVEISGTGQTGHIYVIETADSLAAPVSWASIVTNTFDVNGAFTFNDTNALPAATRFYRVFSQ
jgi:autotransporter-associated beta strand protein